MSWQEELNAKRLKTQGWYGCIAPDGWQQIVEETDAMLAYLDPEYEIHQVKEKFGTLRFYFGTTFPLDTVEHKIMDSIVMAAELKSSRTCEVCGKYGETDWNKPYVRTLCDEHNENNEDNEDKEMGDKITLKSESLDKLTEYWIAEGKRVATERIVRLALDWISEMRGHDGECNCRQDATVLEKFIQHDDFKGEQSGS
jgi:hypothetical protein